MADNADLPGDNAMMADSRRACDSDLSHEQTVRPDFRSVPDTDKIAELAAFADNCIFDCAALKAAVAADFDIVFDYNFADLRNFMMYAFMGGIAVSIFSNCCVCVYDYIIAEYASVIDYRARI
jgi:hypothetical protein